MNSDSRTNAEHAQDMTGHLFIVETELQLLAAMAIENQYLSVGRDVAHYFVTSDKLLNAAAERGRENLTLLDRNHHGGLIGKVRFIKENTRTVLNVAESLSVGSDSCVLYIPRIDDIYNNVLAGQFRKKQLGKVALLPDGALNIFSSNITAASHKALKKWSLKLRLMAPGYSVLQYDGDELGADSEWIDVIYSFYGLNTGYCADKERYIAFPVQFSKAAESDNAIIIGQNFLAYQQTNHDFVATVTAEIHSLLGALKPERVFYAPHPRAVTAEFRTDGMEPVSGPYLCIEEMIAVLGCRYVISCNSTALFTARLIDPSIRCYAVGAESSPIQNQYQRESLLSAMQDAGINVVTLPSAVHAT